APRKLAPIPTSRIIPHGATWTLTATGTTCLVMEWGGRPPVWVTTGTRMGLARGAITAALDIPGFQAIRGDGGRTVAAHRAGSTASAGCGSRPIAGGVGVGFGAGWYPYGTIMAYPPGYRCPRRPKRFHHPGRHPIDHPHHGPVHRRNLIAVNRGPKFTHQLGSVAKASSGLRVFHFEGRNIAPVKTTVHPLRGGPLGEGFASAAQRRQPGLPNRGAYAGSMYRPTISAGRPVYQPGMRPRSGFTPPSRTLPGSTVGRPVQPGQTRGSVPVFRAPERPPTFRAPAPVYHAPPPSFHPAPATAFHPAPSFHP